MSDAPGDRILDAARALLRAPEETTRLRGIHALRDDVADHGVAARALVDALLDTGSYVPHAARAALQDLGVDALPALLDGLRSDESAVRAGCAWSLAREQPRDVSTAIAMLACDTEMSVREAVAGALGRIGGPTAERESALVRLAADAEPRVRTQAVQSLGLLPERSDAGRQALSDALEDSRPAVRIAAAEALAAVAPSAVLIAHVERALEEEPSEHVAMPLRALLERWRPAT